MLEDLFALNSQSTATTLNSNDFFRSLGFAIILSVLMFYIFKLVHDKMTYDPSFNIMLVMISIISTLIMMIVSNNVAISLGMAGTLTLVRFRTNIKDHRDIGFVFLAMFIGITSATQTYFPGLLGTLLVCMILILTSDRVNNSGSMLLVIRGRESDIKEIEKTIEKFSLAYSLKAHNILEDSFELVYDFKTKGDDHGLMGQIIKSYSGVDSVNILTPSSMS